MALYAYIEVRLHCVSAVQYVTVQIWVWKLTAFFTQSVYELNSVGTIHRNIEKVEIHTYSN
jgi:hypothetical protein